MTFKSSYYDGMAWFGVGESSRNIRMDKSTYNAVCTLLNDARTAGNREAAERLVGVVKAWAEEA